MKRVVLAIAALVTLTVVPSFAAVVIDFSDGGVSGGTITLNGANATGSNIAIGQLKFTNGANQTVYTVTGGALNFNTATGAISVVGAVPTLGVSSTTLLSGTFSSSSLTFPVSNILSVSGTGADRKDPALLTALGLPTTTQFAFFGFSIGAFVTTANNYAAFSTDISNTAVPEPTSIILLGSVVFGITCLLRRRAAKV
jgi:hypothetical protein